MRKLIIIVTSAAAASVVALGGYRLGQSHGSHSTDEPSSIASSNTVEPSDENSRLAAAIGQLERRLAALELRQLNARSAEPQAPEAHRGANAGPPDLAALRQTELARVAAIEAALKMEPRDRAWAPAAESQLRTAVDTAINEGAHISVKTLRCLTSICEMVLSASSPDELGHTNFELDSRISGMSSFDVAPPQTAADGSATVTYRLFRNGYPRPDEGT